METTFDQHENHLLLRVSIRAGSSKNELVGKFGEPARLKIKIQAQAVDGQANKELIKFLSKTFKVAKSTIEIIRGEISKQKDLRIEITRHEQSEIVRIINNLSK